MKTCCGRLWSLDEYARHLDEHYRVAAAARDTQAAARQVAADAAATEADPAVRSVLEEFAASSGPVEADEAPTPETLSGALDSGAGGGVVRCPPREAPGGNSRGGTARPARSSPGPEKPGHGAPPPPGGPCPGDSVPHHPTEGRAACAPAVGHADMSASPPRHASAARGGPAQWLPVPAQLVVLLLDAIAPIFSQALREVSLQREAELARWEDDGGPSPEVSPCGGSSRPSRSPSWSSSSTGPRAAVPSTTDVAGLIAAPSPKPGGGITREELAQHMLQGDADQPLALPRPAPGRYDPSGTFPLPPPSADPFRLGHLADARLFLLNAALALEAASIELGGRHALARELAAIHDAAESVRERLAKLEVQLMPARGVALA